MGRDLIEIIREKQTLLSKIQQELDEARALLENGRKARVPERTRAGPVGQRGKRAAAHQDEPAIKSKSSVGRARKILKKVGKPLHVDELVAQINKGRVKVKRTTVVSNLSRYVTERHVFSRTGPNTYGLLEWEQKGKQEVAA